MPCGKNRESADTMGPAPKPPGHWRDDAGEQLAPAITRYLKGERLSTKDVDVIRAYLVQWIDSPTWDQNTDLHDAGRTELAELRRAAAKITRRKAIDEWIEVATDWGMDPL